jgi:hypothetical protein
VVDSSSPLVSHCAPVYVAQRKARTFSGWRSREHAPIPRAGYESPFRVTFSGMGRVQVDSRIFFGTASVVAFGEAK